MTRKYSSTSVATTLSTALSSSATSMTVASGTGSALMGGITLAAGNVDQFALAIDPDTVNEEIVFATQVSTDTFVIVRGGAGTSAVTHSGGAPVKHVLTGDDLNWFNTTSPGTLSTAKGDIVVASASQAVDNLAVGANNTALVADSAQALGVKWQNLSTRTETLTNKTIDGASNTLTNVPTAPLSINAQTSTSYTLVSGDLNKLVTLSNSSAITLTIPSGVFTTGQQVNIQQIGAGQVTIADNGTSSFTGTGTKLRAQYSAATIICTGTNTFTVVGDLA